MYASSHVQRLSASTSPPALNGHLTCSNDIVPIKCHFRRDKIRSDKKRPLAGVTQDQPLFRASSHLNLPLPLITIW